MPSLKLSAILELTLRFLDWSYDLILLHVCCHGSSWHLSWLFGRDEEIRRFLQPFDVGSCWCNKKIRRRSYWRRWLTILWRANSFATKTIAHDSATFTLEQCNDIASVTSTTEMTEAHIGCDASAARCLRVDVALVRIWPTILRGLKISFLLQKEKAHLPLLCRCELLVLEKVPPCLPGKLFFFTLPTVMGI